MDSPFLDGEEFARVFLTTCFDVVAFAAMRLPRS
jgi:hypothetical protein